MHYLLCGCAVGVLALSRPCSGHPVSMLACSAVLSAEPAGAPCMRGDLPGAGMLGLERGARGVVMSAHNEQLPRFSYNLPAQTRSIFLCVPLS